MLQGYIDFFMDSTLAECYLKLKEELDGLIQKKVKEYFYMHSYDAFFYILEITKCVLC